MLCCVNAGGKLVYQYVKKQSSPAVCGVSGVKLNGVSAKLCSH